jgi:hypothetical protein
MFVEDVRRRIRVARKVLGYVNGSRGRFDRTPFYSLRLPLAQCRELKKLLAKTDGQGRRTATLTANSRQPDRLSITETQAPDYERRAAAQYVRGDVIRVQGREGVSCGLDISAKFGVRLVQEQLAGAMNEAKDYIEFRVPSRKRDVIEFIPDTELKPAPGAHEADLWAEASVALAAEVLVPEDFSDWED